MIFSIHFVYLKIAPIRRGDASKVDELISKADCESEDFVLQIPIFGYTTVRELILNLTRTSIQEKIVAFFFECVLIFFFCRTYFPHQDVGCIVPRGFLFLFEYSFDSSSNL